MADFPIKIQVLNTAGDLAYGVSVQHVTGGDTVTWSCENGPFTLSFGNTSPFTEGVELHSSGSPNSFTAHVSSGATLGRYYYGVSISSGGTVYTDPGCPEIIVR